MTRSFRLRPVFRPRAAAGFTLAEVMVTLAIFAIVVVAMLAIFDINGRIARVEGHVSDMQQSLRIAQSDMIRIVRMGARGGLPAALFAEGAFPGRFLPSGVAVEIANNVPANTTIAGKAEAPVLEGTDVLTVRGVFTTVYQANPAGAGFTLDPDNDGDGSPDGGTLILSNVTPTGVPQDLQPLADAIDNTKKNYPTTAEAFMMANPITDFYAVVEIDDESAYAKSGSVITQATVKFNCSASNRYSLLSKGGSFPRDMTTVAYVGVLEEYRYYIRDTRPLNAANVTALEPSLARARLYPGTTTPYANNVANLQEEIADAIFDLQVAMAVDSNGDSVITEGTDTASRRADEWLYNETGDNAAVTATWNGTAAAPAKLYYLRLSTLARTARRDPQSKWQARALGKVEDKDYTQAPFNLFNNDTERRFRRQSLQTVIDLRSLS
jgi:prepilin-type N-terminal cleavage/methylation domain-containing protein